MLALDHTPRRVFLCARLFLYPANSDDSLLPTLRSVGGQGAFVADYNFDPLGLAEKSPDLVPWYRECEIKHGRIAMLAVVGFITAEYVRIPGDMYQVYRNGSLCMNPPS